jgi:hypothetical protein
VVARWEVWRQDDNGNQFKVSEHGHRVEALARIIVLESGMVHKQVYWVAGPPGPAYQTNRDLYLHLVRAGELMNAAGRTLDEFLRAWWLVNKPLSGRQRLDLDTVAAAVTAAGTVAPPPLRAAWRTTSYPQVQHPVTYADWQAVVLSQIADLADFAGNGTLDDDAYFGVDAPRLPGCQRATGSRWYNFDPKACLECGMAGSLGDWDEPDGIRMLVAGPVDPLVPHEPGEQTMAALTWADLAQLAICGQQYE